MNGDGTNEPLPQQPFEFLSKRLLEFAGALRQCGDDAGATALEEMIARGRQEQTAWNESLCDCLNMYHEINNALVGVRGNAQLLLLGPFGSEPETRARLEVVIRESSRIKEAAGRLRDIRNRIETPADGKRVA